MYSINSFFEEKKERISFLLKRILKYNPTEFNFYLLSSFLYDEITRDYEILHKNSSVNAELLGLNYENNASISNHSFLSFITKIIYISTNIDQNNRYTSKEELTIKNFFSMGDHSFYFVEKKEYENLSLSAKTINKLTNNNRSKISKKVAFSSIIKDYKKISKELIVKYINIKYNLLGKYGYKRYIIDNVNTKNFLRIRFVIFSRENEPILDPQILEDEIKSKSYLSFNIKESREISKATSFYMVDLTVDIIEFVNIIDI